MQSQLESVRQYLAAHHMNVVDEWLSGCVEYLTEGNSHTLTEIQNLAKEQWLLNDLKDICPGSLPPGLTDKAKVILNGTFVLQINAAVDIGTPAYQQYLKLQKVNMENVEATTKFEDKISNNRMIKLYLTDGVQEISGIEYKPMRNISCDITPGCKVVIKGPIECRRGVILLQESSVELLGGEVEDMVLSNCLAGVLASKLDLPIPQPQDPTTSILPSINLNSQQNTGPTRESNSEPYNKPVAVVKSVQVSNIIEDDIDFEQLEEIEARFFDKNATINQSVTSNKRESNKTNERVSNSILNYFGNTKNEEAIDNQSGNSSRRNSYQNAGMRYDSDIFDNDIDVQPEKKRKVESFFEFEDEDLREIEKIEMPVLIREPFTYVKEIQELDLTVSFGKVFKVKAQILKLLSKLSVSKEGWSLRCTIVDGTACLDVDFTSDVLSDLVGITPVEMNDIKRQMGTKPELKERAVQALQKAKDNLQVLYCIIEITIMEVPKITKLIPYEEKHVRLLQKRVERSGCFYV